MLAQTARELASYAGAWDVVFRDADQVGRAVTSLDAYQLVGERYPGAMYGLPFRLRGRLWVLVFASGADALRRELGETVEPLAKIVSHHYVDRT